MLDVESEDVADRGVVGERGLQLSCNLAPVARAQVAVRQSHKRRHQRVHLHRTMSSESHMAAQACRTTPPGVYLTTSLLSTSLSLPPFPCMFKTEPWEGTAQRGQLQQGVRTFPAPFLVQHTCSRPSKDAAAV